MENTPTFKFDVEQSEMQRLYAENDFDARLARCDAIEVPAPDEGTRERIMHEVFCCKKRIIRYCGTDTGEEVALIADITPASSSHLKPRRIICRLRIENTVYEAEIPKV